MPRSLWCGTDTLKASTKSSCLGLGAKRPPDVSPLGLHLHRSLKGEPLKHPLRGPVDLGQMEPVAHESLDVKCHQTYEHMGPDPAIHKVIHRPDIERALQGAKIAPYVL